MLFYHMCILLLLLLYLLLFIVSYSDAMFYMFAYF